MKFQKYLQESFSGSREIKDHKGNEIRIEFFTNPKSSEIKDAYKDSKKAKCIRFFADFETKEIIIWQGDILHGKVVKIFRPKLLKKMHKLLCGAAIPISGKMAIIEMDNNEHLFDKIEDNKKWLSKYFINIDEHNVR